MQAGFPQIVDKPLLYGLIAFYAVGAIYVLGILASQVL